MIDHTGVNVSNLELSKAFYLKALAPLGYRICLELESGAGFGRLRPRPRRSQYRGGLSPRRCWHRRLTTAVTGLTQR